MKTITLDGCSCGVCGEPVIATTEEKQPKDGSKIVKLGDFVYCTAGCRLVGFVDKDEDGCIDIGHLQEVEQWKTTKK